MSLDDHAKAARILSRRFRQAAQNGANGSDSGLFDRMSTVYENAADDMEAKAKADAVAKTASCSIDHATILTPRCPACGAPKGKDPPLSALTTICKRPPLMGRCQTPIDCQVNRDCAFKPAQAAPPAGDPV